MSGKSRSHETSLSARDQRFASVDTKAIGEPEPEPEPDTDQDQDQGYFTSTLQHLVIDVLDSELKRELEQLVQDIDAGTQELQQEAIETTTTLENDHKIVLEVLEERQYLIESVQAKIFNFMNKLQKP